MLALATVTCGGGAPRGHVNAASRVGPADVAARRALLARLSPEGEAIVGTYEALPTRYELPEGPYTVSSSDTFDGYFRDSAIENVVTSSMGAAIPRRARHARNSSRAATTFGQPSKPRRAPQGGDTRGGRSADRRSSRVAGA